MTFLTNFLQIFSEAPQLNNKVVSIMNLVTLGMLKDEHIPELENFSSGIETKRGIKKVEKILQDIFEKGIFKMFNIYRMRFNNINGILILDNIPENGTVKETGETEKIEVVHIFDTINQFSTAQLITKLSNHTYVVFMGCYEDSCLVSNALNGMFIDGKKIRVYSLKNPENKRIVITTENQVVVAQKNNVFKESVLNCLSLFIMFCCFSSYLIAWPHIKEFFNAPFFSPSYASNM